MTPPLTPLLTLRKVQSDPTVHVALYDKSAGATDKPVATNTDASTELYTRYTYALGERARLQLDAVPNLYAAVLAKGERSIVPGRARETVFITRDALRHALLTELKRSFPRRAKCFFNYELVSCDLDARALYLRGPKGKEKLVRDWKLLVGADGADSVVRAQMLRHCPRVRCSAYASKRVRKLLRIPVQPADALFSPGRASFIEQPQGLLRGPVVGAATAQRGGGYLVVLSWDGRDEQPWGVRTPTELKRQLLEALPRLRRLDDVELDAFLRRAPMKESYVACSDYCDEDARAVLLGDAAHAAYSMLWQGCTTAFEDAAELNAQLGLCASDDDLAGALRRYSQLRQPEGKAMSDLNLLAHLRFGKSRFFWPRRQSLDKLLADVSDAVNDPEQLYRNVAWSHFAWLALAKLLWMFDREPLDVGTGTGGDTETEDTAGTAASTKTGSMRAAAVANAAGGVSASLCEPAQDETCRDLVAASA
eukprot:6195396-Pleurochrysis_carterae.AAC.1